MCCVDQLRPPWIAFTQLKNRRKKPVHLQIPLITELSEIIDATKTRTTSFLITECGKPLSQMVLATSSGNGAMKQGCPSALRTDFGKLQHPVWRNLDALSRRSWRSRVTKRQKRSPVTPRPPVKRRGPKVLWLRSQSRSARHQAVSLQKLVSLSIRNAGTFLFRKSAVFCVSVPLWPTAWKNRTVLIHNIL